MAFIKRNCTIYINNNFKWSIKFKNTKFNLIWNNELGCYSNNCNIPTRAKTCIRTTWNKQVYKFFGIEKDVATKTKEDIYKIVIAASELSKTKTGALIVIERDIEIKDIISTGVPMEAEVSPQLLVNIFVPKTPLHDGAVIISNNKIAAAACVLPLADDKDIAQELGTRHRAAIGISKESDSIVVVVSEETGKISVAKDGTLIADVREDVLKKILISNVVTKRFTTEKKERKHRIIKQKENKEKQQDNKNEDK